MKGSRGSSVARHVATCGFLGLGLREKKIFIVQILKKLE